MFALRLIPTEPKRKDGEVQQEINISLGEAYTKATRKKNPSAFVGEPENLNTIITVGIGAGDKKRWFIHDNDIAIIITETGQVYDNIN